MATVAGTLLAKGGGIRGNGGSIETSAGTLDVSGATVSAAAANDTGGTWLLDPYNLTVDTAAATSIDDSLNNGTSVTLTTMSSGTSGQGTTSSGDGDILINSALAWNGTGTLTLNAYHSVNVNASITGTNLAVRYNYGASTSSYLGSGTGNFYVKNGAKMTLQPDRGGGLSSLSINDHAYTLITSLSELAAISSGYHALNSDIDAAGITKTNYVSIHATACILSSCSGRRIAKGNS